MHHAVILCVAVNALACSGNDTPVTSAAITGPPGAFLDATAAPQGQALSAESYFGEGAGKQAADQLALEDYAAARAGFSKLLTTATGVPRARLQLLIAVCDERLGNWNQAATGYESALAGLPLLSDYIHYHAARSHYFDHNTSAALAHARATSDESIVGADAKLLVGDLLRGGKKWPEVKTHYAAYLGDSSNRLRREEAGFRLGQALEQLGETAAALEQYRRIRVGSPLSEWAKRAEDRTGELAAAKPEKSGDKSSVEPLTGAELVERGMAYYGAMRNSESESDFEAALKAPGIDAELACVAAYHRANSVFKQRNRTRAAPLFDAAIDICNKSTNADLQVKAAYQAGRSYANIGKRETALERYALIEKHHPEHTYADDARLRQAEEHRELNNDDEVTALLSSIPERYPSGDMSAEATWRLAWRAYKAKRYPEAVKWLNKQIAGTPIDSNYWAEGQAQYWLGRTHAQLGDVAASIAAYKSTIETYPLSYYTLLALNRLRESHPKAFAEVTAKIAAEPTGFDASAPVFFLSDKSLLAAPGFSRAVELLRLGLGEPAAQELGKLGLRAPPGKTQISDKAEIERLWAMAYLYDSAGRYGLSHWVTRWHIVDYKRQWPVGSNRARWRLAYPLAWWPLLRKHADSHGFPPELLIAFVREESAFDPLRESFANAIGLTQMIFPTARRFAKGTGIVVSRETLRDPENNVTIGSRFLSFLVKKFDSRVGLVVPSYNAGEGATGRWLRQRGTWPVDEWAEEIPYDETRNYSKRVIASYFAYSYLRDGTIPAMPNDIPAGVIRGK